MSQVSLELPQSLVGPVRESVLLLYEATAEALHLALRARAEGRAQLEEVHAHRCRLNGLGAFVDQLGWPPQAPTAALGVTAPRDLLHDALYATLIDAGERLAAECAGCWRGELTMATVRATAAEVIALDRLLWGFAEKGGSPS